MPIVDITSSSMKLCTGLIPTKTACNTYREASYAAAQVRRLAWPPTVAAAGLAFSRCGLCTLLAGPVPARIPAQHA